MASTESDVTAAVKRYCSELSRMGIQCERVLLFGSHAAGQAAEGSDIDLIVISPALEAYSPRERLELLGIAAARVLEPIQALGVTPKEAATRHLSPFVQEVLDENAVVIV